MATVTARTIAAALAVVAAPFVAAGCASTGFQSAATTTPPSPADTAITTVGPPDTSPSTCHARGSAPYVLPDPSCTPGVADPAVTASTIRSTICVTGYTKTVRPPESYTEPLKVRQMAAYGDTAPISTYEEDHLIPLELGGSPSDPRNLWPEPGASPNPKDKVESAAHTQVCEGHMALAAAQQAIATDWIAFGRQLGVIPPR